MAESAAKVMTKRSKGGILSGQRLADGCRQLVHALDCRGCRDRAGPQGDVLGCDETSLVLQRCAH